MDDSLKLVKEFAAKKDAEWEKVEASRREYEKGDSFYQTATSIVDHVIANDLDAALHDLLACATSIRSQFKSDTVDALSTSDVAARLTCRKTGVREELLLGFTDAEQHLDDTQSKIRNAEDEIYLLAVNVLAMAVKKRPAKAKIRAELESAGQAGSIYLYAVARNLVECLLHIQRPDLNRYPKKTANCPEANARLSTSEGKKTSKPTSASNRLILKKIREYPHWSNTQVKNSVNRQSWRNGVKTVKESDISLARSRYAHLIDDPSIPL